MTANETGTQLRGRPDGRAGESGRERALSPRSGINRGAEQECAFYGRAGRIINQFDPCRWFWTRNGCEGAARQSGVTRMQPQSTEGKPLTGPAPAARNRKG